MRLQGGRDGGEIEADGILGDLRRFPRLEPDVRDPGTLRDEGMEDLSGERRLVFGSDPGRNDDAVAGRPFHPELIAELDSLAPRGYTSGFLERRPSQDYQAYEKGGMHARHHEYVGQVLQVVEGWAEVALQDTLSVGDTLEVIHPSGNHLMQLNAMRNAQGLALETTLALSEKIWVELTNAPVLHSGALLARVR